MSKDELVLPRKINASNPGSFARTAEEHSSDTFDVLRKMKDRLERAVKDVSELQAAFNGLLATEGPSGIDAGDPQILGISPRAAREDHGHDVHTGAPSRGIGGGNSEGTSIALARADHNHLLRETSGPTDLLMGGILADEILRRVSGSLVGRQLDTCNTTGTASTTSGTLVDVAGSLNFTLGHAAEGYIGIWMLGYITQTATNGLLLSINFSGTAGTQRHGVIIATGATTMFSAWESANFDVPLGNPTVGPGGTARVALLFCRVAPNSTGTLALRYASGVAGQSVTIANRSFGLLLQQ
jgi:hypothetical protein